MERITVAQAAQEWNVPVYTVRWFCENNRLPPGYTVIVKRGSKRNTFYIFKEGVCTSQH